MNKEEVKRLEIIESVRPEMLAESIPREIYVLDTMFLIKIIRRLEEDLKDKWEYE